MAAGLPGEFLFSSNWRSLLATHSPLHNPAVLMQSDFPSLRGAFSTVLQEFINTEAGITIPVGLYQTYGLSWYSHGVRPYDGYSDYTFSGEEITDRTNAFLLSYAVNPWKRASLGINLTLIHRSPPGGNTQVGFGGDAGLTLGIMQSPLLGEHVFGAALQNAVAPNPGEEYARSLNFSLMSNYRENKLNSNIQFKLKDLFGNTKEWDLDVSLGVWLLRFLTADALFGMGDQGADYVGMAVGVNFPAANQGRDLALAFQYLTRISETDVNPVSFYFRTNFGKAREERYARKIAEILNVKPNDLYQRAMNLVNEEKYWEAFFVLGSIKSEFPNFFKMDWVEYYSGLCLQKLDMDNAALQTYKKVINDYSKSSVVPFTRYAALQIFRQQDNNQQIHALFNELNTAETPDSIKFHVYYEKAMHHFDRNEFEKAAQLLTTIPSTHPDYLFASHTLALMEIQRGNTQKALQRLREIISRTAKSKIEEIIINRSKLIAGYLFYENIGDRPKALSNAVAILREIPRDSEFYPESQLALGYCAYKAGQWEDCFDAGDEVIKTSSEPLLEAEGALLKGFSRIMTKNYSEALNILEPYAEKLDQYTPLTRSTMRSSAERYSENLKKYNEIAERAMEIALQRETPEKVKARDSLSTVQEQWHSKIKSFTLLEDRRKSLRPFSKNYEKLKEDLFFALAHAEKKTGMRATDQMREKHVDEQEKIDDEIERLKREMEQLEQ